MKTFTYAIIALENLGAIALWGALAWHFDKWWLTLFAAFWSTTVKYIKTDDK
jgi:hypothetical protein